ncbi:biotin/lipoyl-binding protein [Desulfovibrio sp.]|uniref:HlyD family secretion protein n=1 Tax=Desulfovibrio sp. TaxID=885 RepID=UPI0025BF04CC|nr:biotin/lipoyl-binding protein [Desulfovibrio sp.]
MSEALYIEMPPRKSGKKSLWLRLLPLWVLVLLLLGCAWLWLAQGRIISEHAFLDAMVHVVAPEFSAPVEGFFVREGDSVRRGQPLLRLNARAYHDRLAEAGREGASLRGMAGQASGPPTMEEAAARLKAAQEAEQDMVRRLALARNEEDARLRLQQDSVALHVRLQLDVRSLDAQGGERAVGKNRYAAAVKSETQARRQMELSRVEHEEASRMRAALEQELGRIRQEMLRYKQMSSRQRYAPVPSAMPEVTRKGHYGTPADASLYAPVDGRVLRITGAAGQMARSGEALVLLLPEGAAVSENYWLLAYFAQDRAEGILPGLPCRIELEDGQTLRGTVLDVLAPQVLPGGKQEKQGGTTMQSGISAVLYTPVRISIEPGDKALPPPGTQAGCVVFTRNLWGFYGF